MNGKPHLGPYFAHLVDRFAQNAEHPAQGLPAHGDRDGLTLVHGLHPPHHPVGRLHGDALDDTLAQMLRHFDGQVDVDLGVESLRRDMDGVVDVGNVIRIELDVQNRTDDLQDFADVLRHD